MATAEPMTEPATRPRTRAADYFELTKPKIAAMALVTVAAGYLLGAAFTHWAVFDVKPDDVYWCAADIGWVTGHSYIVYGPLANATTSIAPGRSAADSKVATARAAK